MGIFDSIDAFVGGPTVQLEQLKAKLARDQLLRSTNAQNTLLGGPQYDGSGNPLLDGSGSPINYQPPTAPQAIQNNPATMGQPAQNGPGSAVDANGQTVGGMNPLQLGPQAPMRYASQVSVPGLLGNEALDPQQYQQKQEALLGQASPDYAMMKQRLSGMNISPTGQTLLAVDPTGKTYGEFLAKTNELTPVQKVTNYLQTLPADDPRRKYLENWLQKEGGIETDPLKIKETNANIAEKGAQTDLAKQRADLMKTTGLDDDTINMRAQMWAAGDHAGAFQGIPNSIYGSPARAAISQRGAQLLQQKGLTGADAAASGAEFFGTKAGERTLGTRSANIEMAVSEAQKMGDIAQNLSDQLPRGQWMPVNKAIQSFREQTGNPQARSFGASVNSFLNAYATAVGKGTMTVEGRRHAEDMLSKADGPEAFKAIMGTLQQEMAAAREAPAEVRGQMRGAITGQPAQPPAPRKVLKFNPATGKIE